MPTEFFENGHTNALTQTVESLLQSLRSSDYRFVNEASLKCLILAALVPNLPHGYRIESELKMPKRGYADLVVYEKTQVKMVIELKYVRLEYIGETEHKKILQTREDEQKMANWLTKLPSHKIPDLLIDLYDSKQAITAKQHLNDAFQQALGYATQLQQEEVLVIALVGLGTRILAKAGRLLQ